MAKGFKHGGGGGSNPLNFKVVKNPQPAAPGENTIWVNTDIDIPAWYFSATQPENLNEGDVWFSTGTSSPVEFNALKKNGIQVYPTSAKQYVSGALVDVTAKSYQGGAWVDWVTVILSPGVDNTGGFVWYSSGSSASATKNSGGSYTITRPSGVSAGYLFKTVESYDLTDVTTLKFNVVAVSGRVNIGVTPSTTASAKALTACVDTVVVGEQTLDVSAITGDYAFGLNMFEAGGSVTIDNVVLVR